MATRIKETPVITGNDAISFLKNVFEKLHKPFSREDEEEVKKMKEAYDLLKSISVGVTR